MQHPELHTSASVVGVLMIINEAITAIRWTSYGQKIETAQRRQRSNIFGLGPVLHNKLAVDA